MKNFDRRRFLFAAAATTALTRTKSFAQTAAASAPATLTLHPEQTVARVPENFIGLSYETQQLSDPTFFSPQNTALIAQFRVLSSNGVLRIGGNTSDVGWWKPTPNAVRPEIHTRVRVGEPSAANSFAIEPQAIRSLRGFLDATGWTCLYGINLGTNTPTRAADEAAFVSKTLGPRLEYFQLGNEPDLFSNHLRDPHTWSADMYFDEWLAEANAIRGRVPDARFGLPDTAGNPEWYARVVTRLAALNATDRPYVAALSHHYYFSGPPSNPTLTIERLLHTDPHVAVLAHDIRAAAEELSHDIGRTVPYRMTEGNTCYQGGKPGVSDVFASSLWAADYLLTLASDGYAGANLHGGGGKEVAASLGGKLPGEALLTNPNAPHPRPFYTPIADMNGRYIAEPVFYGMFFAQQFAGAQLFAIDFNPGSVNATAYAGTLPGGDTLLALINKDETQILTVDVPGEHHVCATMLTAPSVSAHSARWNGGSLQASDGNPHPCQEKHDKRSRVTVPAASAMLLRSA